jgi:hypothetical protein
MIESRKTPFKRSREVEDLSDNLEEIFREIQDDLLYGNTVAVAVSTTTVKVNHKLGTTPQGWIIVDKDADINVWRDGDATANFLPLKADGTGNIKVRIY